MAKDENKESEIRGDEQEIVDQRLPAAGSYWKIV